MADRVDEDALRAVMEDDEPEVQWEDLKGLEDTAGIEEPGLLSGAQGNGWVVRFIDVAIILIILAIGFLLFGERV